MVILFFSILGLLENGFGAGWGIAEMLFVLYEKIGIITKATFLCRLNWKNGVEDHLICQDQPFVQDVFVERDLHIGFELVRKMRGRNVQKICNAFQGETFADVVADVLNGFFRNRG